MFERFLDFLYGTYLILKKRNLCKGSKLHRVQITAPPVDQPVDQLAEAIQDVVLQSILNGEQVPENMGTMIRLRIMGGMKHA